LESSRPWIGVTQLVNYGVGVRRRVELMLNELTQAGSLHCALCCYDAGDDWGHLLIDSAEDPVRAVCGDCQDGIDELYSSHHGRDGRPLELTLDDEEVVATYQVFHLRRLLGGSEGQVVPITLSVR